MSFEELIAYFLIIMVFITLWAVATDPFSNKRSLFRWYPGRKLIVTRNPIAILLSYIKNGIHMAEYALVRKTRIRGEASPQFIAQKILEKRLDESMPFLISGDHFPLHYPRNMGIFYYPAYDMKEARGILRKTLLFNLEVFGQTKKLYTTIVPISRHHVTPIQVYAYPSDTMYSILYAAHRINDHEILHRYRSLMQELLDGYLQTVFDKKTGYIRTDIHLSGIKDISKRRGAFYDNVILWATLKLATHCGLTHAINVAQLKKSILNMFWNDTDGYFYEDTQIHFADRYSSDWLVVYFTQFLDLHNKTERAYYERIIHYIQSNHIAEPIPLRYHINDHARNQFHVVRLFLPEYGGSAIWSFWGMEYCKVLIELSQITENRAYLMQAGAYLEAYEKNMVEAGGFPETFSTNGTVLHKPWYRSIIVNGWVVNYLQAKQLFKHAEKTFAVS